MHKSCFGRVVLVAILLILVPPFAFASDMGNGSAGLFVWFCGTIIAVMISFVVSFSKDELILFYGFKTKKFIIVFIALLPFVFIIGVVAIFL